MLHHLPRLAVELAVEVRAGEAASGTGRTDRAAPCGEQSAESRRGIVAPMDEEERERRLPTNEEAQRSVRVIAVIFFAIGLVIAYFVWPSGVMDQPHGSVTVRAWLRMLAAAAVTFAPVGWALTA
jgi:hypothetical protein